MTTYRLSLPLVRRASCLHEPHYLAISWITATHPGCMCNGTSWTHTGSVHTNNGRHRIAFLDFLPLLCNHLLTTNRGRTRRAKPPFLFTSPSHLLRRITTTQQPSFLFISYFRPRCRHSEAFFRGYTFAHSCLYVLSE